MKDIPTLIKFAFVARSSATPFSDSLAQTDPFLVADGEVSPTRYLALLLVCLGAAMIPIIVMSKVTGQGNKGVLRNVAIFLLGVPFALTPLTLPMSFGFFGYAIWRAVFPTTKTA